MERVQLDELILVDFRNIHRSTIEPSPRFNIVSGRNGMGKTNLLESIYIIGSMRSFRHSRRVDMVRRGAKETSIRGRFGDVCAGMMCEITMGHEGRQVKIDGKNVHLDGRYFHALPMVIFHPGNLTIVQGGPDARRRFLDRALFQAEISYQEAYRSYGKALANRNRILKTRPLDKRVLDSFDEQLASHGARIVMMRERLVISMTPLFEEAMDRIGGEGQSRMAYRPKVEGGFDEIMSALRDAVEKDTAMGYTTVGPHADDLVFEVKGSDARRFASQGQQRTVVLAAKIAETGSLEKSTGRTPLLLLDDVSSELDRDRNRHLFGFLAGLGGQVFITTTHNDHIPIEGERVDFFVENGSIAVN